MSEDMVCFKILHFMATEMCPIKFLGESFFESEEPQEKISDWLNVLVSSSVQQQKKRL